MNYSLTSSKPVGEMRVRWNFEMFYAHNRQNELPKDFSWVELKPFFELWDNYYFNYTVRFSCAAMVEWSKCLVKGLGLQVRGRPKWPLLVVRKGHPPKNAHTLLKSDFVCNVKPPRIICSHLVCKFAWISKSSWCSNTLGWWLWFIEITEFRVIAGKYTSERATYYTQTSSKHEFLLSADLGDHEDIDDPELYLSEFKVLPNQSPKSETKIAEIHKTLT